MPHDPKHITDEKFKELTQAPFTRVKELALMRSKVMDMTDGLTDEESLAIADLTASVTRAVLVAEAAAYRIPPNPAISREVVDQANTWITTGQRARGLAGQAIVEEGAEGRQNSFRADCARALQLLIDILGDFDAGQPVDVERQAARLLTILLKHGPERVRDPGGNPGNPGNPTNGNPSP